MSEQFKRAEAGVLGWIDRDITGPMADFQDPQQEWRRLFSELYGTFLLVIVAAGGGMMGEAFPNTISRTAAVVAPGLMVMGIIMFMGKVSGAHLNPAVSIAFSLRGDFPWRRVPGYVIVQLVGASLAALFLHEVIKVSAKFGSNYPASGYSGGQAYLMEALLTLGLVSVILGTASGAQNIGIFGAIGVGAYIALAGLWGSPISGASMNPARTFGPDLVGRDFGSYWVYVAGPLTGAIIAVGFAYVLRAQAAAKPDRPPLRAGSTRTSRSRHRPDRRDEMTRPFKGMINIDITKSTPDWGPYAQPMAPDGAPNIALHRARRCWLLGDGAVRRPDRDAEHQPDRRPTALVYTNFHTTALCSPTRSCLLTGRNHTTNSMAASPRPRPASRTRAGTSPSSAATSPRCSVSAAGTPTPSASGTCTPRTR